jgi:hypothetical protein
MALPYLPALILTAEGITVPFSMRRHTDNEVQGSSALDAMPPPHMSMTLARVVDRCDGGPTQRGAGG